MHGRKEKPAFPVSLAWLRLPVFNKGTGRELRTRSRPWVECGVWHLHVHCHGHHTHADKRHIHAEFCRCRIDAQTMRRSQWEKGMRFWLLDVRRVGWKRTECEIEHREKSGDGGQRTRRHCHGRGFGRERGRLVRPRASARGIAIHARRGAESGCRTRSTRAQRARRGALRSPRHAPLTS